MVRVLHVVTYMGRGGLETMLMNYYRHMDRSRVQFDFLVHRDFEADYDAEILALGGRIYRVSRLVPWSRSYRAALKRFFLEHPEYRIVHVHQDCLSAVALSCAKECGVPVRIAHSHNSNQDRNLKFLIKKHYMKQIPRFATDYFACGKAAGDWMFGGQPYRVLCNAIDSRQYAYSTESRKAMREALGLRDELVMGHVGRFHPQKNHTFLIDVFAEVVRKAPDAKLLLVGDGDGRAEAEEKIRNLGLKDRVIFAGVRSDVDKLLQAMDVFVFPSLYEGLGIVAVEAQAAGLPCVVSDRVPQECIVTQGLVTRLPLEETAQRWANVILQQCGRQREDHVQEVADAGYDIFTTAPELEKFYLNCAEGE